MNVFLPDRLHDGDLFRQRAWVAGEWIDAANGECVEVNNPATGEIVGTVPALSATEVRSAIAAADRALPEWRGRTATARGAILRRWSDLMLQHQDDLATIMTIEQGKPIEESRGEIAYAASFLDWFGDEAKRAYGEVIPSPWPDRRITVLRQPVGVCAAITPWNFPAAMIARKIAPALAAGCTMVVKPAEATPFSALAMAVLAQRAGVPDGVMSVVTGKAKIIGAELAGNALVRKLSFTGSTAVGKQLMAQCAGTMKKLSLELGGNAPFIVFDDADLDAAVAGAIASKFRNAGQTCVCANRFYVQAGIHDRFVERFTAAAAALKVGNGLDEGVQVGPLINAAAIEKVERHIADAVAGGGRAVIGGERVARAGHFFPPTVIDGVRPDALAMREETFGPVAAIVKFMDDGDALRLANDSPFGLAAYFYTRDAARVWHIAEGIESGMVGINTGIVSTAVAPFGGIKESGIGREGSRHGLDEYMELKYLCQGGV